MKLKTFKTVVMVVCILNSLLGCSQLTTISNAEKIYNSEAKVNTEDNLFNRMGGLTVIKIVVSETIDEVSSNPKTARSFKDLKLPKLKESVVSQICMLTGGGCEYDGETMINSHKDAKISTAEFEIFVAVFRESLSKHTKTREKNELLKILAPMKRDIVTAKELI
ncbi:MAG: group 1 truncated hemoglobin [Methylotenera sp.]|uniref:group I truncated hemoglobin n=1 Tax=Methylotenera sp. TaxID=2051956 RepID=UPI0024896064|nr:group 1 truncated hemoglobin [Methylotenera sp.]MDI1309950.1 group 1 truncated hemoglobin [Methylotenera sp.]